MLSKNTSGQKVRVYAFDSTTGQPKTADAANITAYVSKDFGAVTQLTDTTATEESSSNAPGYYLFDISQTETNADDILVSGKSSTSNIVVVGAPARIRTVPANAGNLSVDSNGRVDVIKVAGTTQTALDLGGTWTAARAAHLDADVSSRMATYTQPTGFLAATFPASVAAVGSAMTLTSGERDSIAAALLDLSNGVETGKTLRQALRLMAAALAGKRSNAGTATEQYDAIGNPGTARVVGNLDASGNGTPTLTP